MRKIEFFPKNNYQVGFVTCFTDWQLQGLSVLFACVGSGDPVRVLRIHNEYTKYTLKHLLLRHMYNLSLPNLCATCSSLATLRLPTVDLY